MNSLSRTPKRNVFTEMTTMDVLLESILLERVVQTVEDQGEMPSVTLLRN